MILIEVMGDVYKISRKRLYAALTAAANGQDIDWNQYGTVGGTIRLHATDLTASEARNIVSTGLPEYWK